MAVQAAVKSGPQHRRVFHFAERGIAHDELPASFRIGEVGQGIANLGDWSEAAPRDKRLLQRDYLDGDLCKPGSEGVELPTVESRGKVGQNNRRVHPAQRRNHARRRLNQKRSGATGRIDSPVSRPLVASLFGLVQQPLDQHGRGVEHAAPGAMRAGKRLGIEAADQRIRLSRRQRGEVASELPGFGDNPVRQIKRRMHARSRTQAAGIAAGDLDAGIPPTLRRHLCYRPGRVDARRIRNECEAADAVRERHGTRQRRQIEQGRLAWLQHPAGGPDSFRSLSHGATSAATADLAGASSCQ
jgi:hypothetical protein